MNDENKIILKNRKKFGRFFGQFRNESNEFTIQSVGKAHSSTADKVNHEPIMYQIYKYMSCTPDTSLVETYRFKSYIDLEESDTESFSRYGKRNV